MKRREPEENRLDLDYEEKKKDIIKYLESEGNDTMVLATSSDDIVLARTVLIFSKGLELYFFTWGNSRKCDQIRRNPNIALCKDNMMIEGVAEIVGGLSEERNREYKDFMRNKNPESIERWEKRPNMIIVRVKPLQIVYGSRIIDGCVYLEFMDLQTKRAYAEKWAHY
ncbi:MAG: pyridoxamine 5'-phosphate oxidase family protein [Theionarchaea archaeon]|nr:pyridoxamine 5'-phosphate oxidase family protein [Theionarchaea archaeon]